MKRSIYFLSIPLLTAIILFSGCVEEMEKIKTPEPQMSESSTEPTLPLNTTSTVIKSPLPTIPESTTQTPLEDEADATMDLNEANVIGVEFTVDSSGIYTFAVSVRHNDTGWDHYADWWRIKTEEGEEIARRVLTHPHENEQPFTRSLGGIIISNGIDKVIVEAHDNVHGYGGQTMVVDLKTDR